jgi:hypothetical protein
MHLLLLHLAVPLVPLWLHLLILLLLQTICLLLKHVLLLLHLSLYTLLYVPETDDVLLDVYATCNMHGQWACNMQHSTCMGSGQQYKAETSNDAQPISHHTIMLAHAWEVDIIYSSMQQHMRSHSAMQLYVCMGSWQHHT